MGLMGSGGELVHLFTKTNGIITPICYIKVGLGDMDKIKYHNMFDQIPLLILQQYTIGALTEYLHNEIIDKSLVMWI